MATRALDPTFHYMHMHPLLRPIVEPRKWLIRRKTLSVVNQSRIFAAYSLASESQEYVLHEEIASFFSRTSVHRETCGLVAKELVDGSQVVPVNIQGVCSYTVYAGQDLGHVFQFRLKSLELKTETAALARQVYGSFVPDVSLKRQLGEDSTTAGQEPLLVYVMARIKGISRLDFILAHGFPENSPENMARRKNLIQDVARFFALAWNAPQEVDQAYRNRMAGTFEKELQMLLATLPERFSTIIRATLASLPRIVSLPMVLLHKYFSDCNIMVEEPSCRSVDVIDYAEAEIAPFGMNLHSLQDLMSKLHLINGWIKYEDYDDLDRSFWETFNDKVGGLGEDTTTAIKAARVLGLLRFWGFTNRLANQPKPVPIKDDDGGRYGMMILDGLLLNPNTRFEGLAEWLR